MVLRVKCEYCDNYIDETLETCPHCGAPNEHMMRSGTGVPKTIDELLAFAEAQAIPLERMRFFIGRDYRQPKAFGIYQDEEGKFVVYKNKADGSRVVRYRGDDEAYAVNEIYQKMRAEVLQRRQARGALGGGKGGSGRRSGKSPADLLPNVDVRTVIALAIFLAVFAAYLYLSVGSNNRSGYYSYDNAYYYYDDGWYRDTDDGWVSTSVPTELDDNYETYYEGRDYDGLDDDGVTEWVSDTKEDDWWSSSWDDDDWSSSDWDSWDSSSTDWDSDW